MEIKLKNKLKKIFDDLLAMPDHKIVYVIHDPELCEGLIQSIQMYGVKYTQEVHDELVEYVQNRLDGPDIEREWSDLEYNNFVMYKGIVQ